MFFSDPFRDFDALANELFSSRRASATIPMAAWRDENSLTLEFELPGIEEDAIHLEVDQNVLTLTVDKPYREVDGSTLINERQYGVAKRMLRLDDTLNTEAIDASLSKGLLTLRVPLLERAKPRKITLSVSKDDKQLESSKS